MTKILQITEVTILRTNYYLDTDRPATVRNKQVDSFTVERELPNQELFNVDNDFQNKIIAIKEIIK